MKAYKFNENLYLDEIKGLEPLSPDEEVRLAQAARGGDADAFRELVLPGGLGAHGVEDDGADQREGMLEGDEFLDLCPRLGHARSSPRNGLKASCSFSTLLWPKGNGWTSP